MRGWFRQDDFPQNELLYDNLDRPSYLHWLRRLSVRYVVLTDAPLDYSARTEAELLRSGRSGLPIVFATAHATVYAVPSPVPIVTGPGRPHVDQVSESSVTRHDHPPRQRTASGSATRPTSAPRPRA